MTFTLTLHDTVSRHDLIDALADVQIQLVTSDIVIGFIKRGARFIGQWEIEQ